MAENQTIQMVNIRNLEQSLIQESIRRNNDCIKDQMNYVQPMLLDRKYQNYPMFVQPSSFPTHSNPLAMHNM